MGPAFLSNRTKIQMRVPRCHKVKFVKEVGDDLIVAVPQPAPPKGSMIATDPHMQAARQCAIPVKDDGFNAQLRAFLQSNTAQVCQPATSLATLARSAFIPGKILASGLDTACMNGVQRQDQS